MKLVWTVRVYGKRCIWASFRQAWADYLDIVRDEPFMKVAIYPGLRRQVDLDKMPEHKGW